jgi:hypothetical protein
MTRDDLISAMAELMAGLAVPVSLGLPLGRAGVAWTELHGGLIGFGWSQPEDYEAKIREVLGASARRSSEREVTR